METLLKKDFYFDLPQELIAQDPLKDRQSSRLLILDKESGAISHHIFREITDYLKEGDCLVTSSHRSPWYHRAYREVLSFPDLPPP